MELRNRDFSQEPVVLEVENLIVALPGGTPVLRDVSFDIRKGETVCLVGESGSGKSVTSLTAMGLLPKDALKVKGGAIRLDGNDLLKLSLADMKKMRATRISMIFQEPMTALNPVMRVGEQITEVLDIHTALSAEAKRAKVINIMEQVHLPDVERIYQSYPHQLSGGQRQRIMIAMALILEPMLLIADEPTTALDVTTQKQILSLIAELQEKHGTAVLFITHDMGVVAEIADRVCVMRSGEIVERGTIRQVLTRPQQQYTKDLLGSVPSLVPRAAREPLGHDPVIRVRNLGMTYQSGSIFSRKPGVKASREVTFDLQPGRTLGIVGESGSGKTTVARSIMRLIEPTEGEIVVDGRDIAHLGKRDMKPFRKKLQVVFQDPFRSLNPRWTIEQSLTEGPVNYGVPYEEAVAEAKRLLKIVSLPEDALKRYPHQFSGGQRQRIAIARAVALRPDILVADEAVSALDVSVQAQVLDLLAELQKDTGIAIIFITHDLRVAAQICDEVLVMKRGEVVEQGEAANVLGSPSHDYTRALIEAAPGRFWDFAAGQPVA
ncbi:ABC transporter ATP-binding protein [Ochrobactrum soli]|uniref:ABC transporter ATP-binding protein n=1 Tax=Brucella/Ochrobactrum group TaxID=2826938 RepID=UPI000EF1C633|nr:MULTISPECIES: ABC transporter ATP-binding protein [Brucella]MCI0999365.1 ABC transporter ATP-binding protein [Ochrobactrum sp. C6C9]RRD22191.1 ABC transporter ATP-binding protein [Brucellaceae bacterium VT-16-1752]WHT45215.1 ABC transporter ATP-binding protein [Ochrobactrum sp. SSR]MDX4073336.1 ABC transporter ATP-binding protein [Brucella sp. NBRC 113783]RLL71216.1 ABC transporter ATP-binding protein [[Ochrobactrum] soli]